MLRAAVMLTLGRSQLTPDGSKQAEKWESMGTCFIFVIVSERDRWKPYRIISKSATTVWHRAWHQSI